MSLDNALPAAGFLRVTLPSGLSHAFSTCNAFALGATFKAPTTFTHVGTVSGSGSIFFCTFSAAMAANTAYGVALGVASSTATAGVYAPIGLQTRMNSNSAKQGPVMDSNPVFDSAVVIAAPATLDITFAKATADAEKKYPGDSYKG